MQIILMSALALVLSLSVPPISGPYTAAGTTPRSPAQPTPQNDTTRPIGG